MKRQKIISVKILAGLVLFALMFIPTFVEAATITVNSTADDNDGVWGNGHDTLREAIAYATAGDTINFNLTYPATITLSSQLTLNKNLTITGPGADKLTISGNNSVRIFYITSGTITVSGITVANGFQNVAAEHGIAFYLFNSGINLTINDCVVRNNTSNGSSYSIGAGFFVTTGAVLTINRSYIHSNDGPTTNCSSGSEGGAIYSTGTLSISNSTISNNRACAGSAISARGGSVTLLNSTISGNHAYFDGTGAAVFVYASLTITNTTITQNIGEYWESGLSVWCLNSVNMKNSIVAGNISIGTGGSTGDSDIYFDDGTWCSGNAVTFTSGGYNLIGSEGSLNYTWTTGDAHGEEASKLDAGMNATLSDNGGYTLTHALNAGSVAIDPASSNGSPFVDQRGYLRSGNSDKGAFEYNGTLPVATAATGVTATSFSANWNAVSGATGYRLDVATDSGFTSFVSGFNDLDVGNVTTKSVTGLSAGTTYYYRIRAYNGSELSYYSNTITVSPIQMALTVTTAGTGTGTVTSNPAGIDCGTDCDELYDYNTAVTLTATPDTGSTFTGWSGDADCSDGQVTMTADISCTATFTLNTYTVTVTKTGTGTGTVTSNPAGIDCGTDCDELYDYNTTVTLTATPDASSSFGGWSGDADCADGQVTMTADITCTATFTLNTYALTANAGGNGAGAVASDIGGISYNYPANNTGTTTPLDHGSSVTITANAGTGSTVTWGGTCTFAGGIEAGNGTTTATCTFSSLDGNKIVTTTFTLNTYTVTTTANNGVITSTINPTVNHGSTTTVTGSADAGYYFSSVSGCGGATQNNSNQSVTTFSYTTGAITANCEVTAIFAQQVCTPPPSGMVSWWKAEDNTDDSIGPNNGTLMNGATFAGSKVGRAFSFDGIDDYTQVVSPAGLPTGNSARTIDLWFRTPRDITVSTESAIIQYGTASTNNMFGLVTSINAPGKLYFYGYSNDLAGTTTLLPDTWYHAAVTYDGSTLSLYLNGQLEASKSTTALNTVIDGNGLSIGIRPELPSYWEGLIDEVEIFNRALTSEEITAIYNANSEGKCAVDTDPDAFTFTDQTNAALNTIITSNTITVNGIDYAAPISITVCTSSSCEYSINGGAWTSSTGSVNSGDTVQVRQISSGLYSATTDLTLSIGGVSDTFSVTTIPQYTLAINKTGTGSGMVTSNPAGIDCGTDCSELYIYNTVVTLTPTEDTGSAFSGWSGDADCADGQVTMTADITCIATFTLNTHALTVTKSGTGSGTVTSNPAGISCGADCSENYDSNTTVTLTATPDAGSKFTAWSGDADCADGQVTMDADKTCTAIFYHKGDFNGDGQTDILWRHKATGENKIWVMNGTTRTGEVSILADTNRNWKIGGTGDFNADGKEDILWRNKLTGESRVWLMDGTILTSAVSISASKDLNWRIVGTGDFNADGKEDILWRNKLTGENKVWLMDGTTLTGAVSIPASKDLNWKIVGTGDFNADGKEDILWRNKLTGKNKVWLMDGTARTSSVSLPAFTNLKWKIVGPK